MRAAGSFPSRVLPPVPALAVTFVGVTAMIGGGAALAGRVGIELRALIAFGSVLLAVPTIVVLLLGRLPWRETVALGRTSRRMLLLSALLGTALWIASIGLIEMQSLIVPPTPEYLERFRAIHRALAPSGPLDAMVSVAVIALLPGVAEELVLRGVLLPSLVTPFSRAAAVLGAAFLAATMLQNPYQSAFILAIGLILGTVLAPLGQAGAVLASALLFAAMHLDPYRFVFALTIGLALGTVRLRTGSLWPPIVAHATLNTLTFLVAPLVDDPSQTVYTPQPALGLACLLAGSALTFAVARALRPFVDSPEKAT